MITFTQVTLSTIKINMKQINLTTERLLKDANIFVIDPSSESYINSYPAFLEYFRKIGEIMSEEQLFISSHFIYGWMPTILTLHTTIIDEEKGEINILNDVLRILDKARREEETLNVIELNTLKRCINNSMVGVSKMLHFTNPNKYPIWDSKVFRYATKTGRVLLYVTEKASTYGIDNPELYLQYMNRLKAISTSGYNEIESVFKDKIKDHKLSDKLNDLSPYRVMEMIMFESVKKIESTRMDLPTQSYQMLSI